MEARYVLGMVAAFTLALGACKREEPPKPAPAPAPTTSAPAPAPPPSAPGVSVAAITLGSAIDADRKPTQAADTFSAKDTIYASVATSGTGTATLKAKWTYHQNGQETVVKEDAQTIQTTGAANSEFHISKPDGWPEGNYQVAILVNDKPAGTKTFTVR